MIGVKMRVSLAGVVKGCLDQGELIKGFIFHPNANSQLKLNL